MTDEIQKKRGRPAMHRPESANSASARELDKVSEQFDAFDANIQQMTLDRMNAAPKKEEEQQTKLSSREMEKAPGIYLKPEKSIGTSQKFNEKFRDKYLFDKEYVQFIAENKEIIGETIEIWTRPYGGMPAEFWKVPCNKPVWGPRYLAEQIKRASYHRFVMQQSPVSGDSVGQYYGAMAVDTVVQRLDAIPASTRKSIFMGAQGF
jgi:hypothetical protein